MKTRIMFLMFQALLPLVILTSCATGTDNTPTSCAWQTVFSDDFKRADGPIGSNYTVQVNTGTGSPVIVGGTMQFNGPADFWAIRYITGVTGDIQRVSMKFIGKNTFSIGVALKSRDLGNNWAEQEYYMAVVNQTSLSILKSQGSTPAYLSSKDLSITQGHQYQLIFTLDGEELGATCEDLTAGGKTVITATDSGTPNTGTIVSMNGCCLNTEDFILIDDFKVEVCK